MLFKSFVLLSLVAGLASASALPDVPLHQLKPRASSTIPANATACTVGSNVATDRACWNPAPNGNFSIYVDAEESWPITGNTVQYTLVLDNVTLYPDGTAKDMLVLNGTFPGPTLTANWGDLLEITVINNLTNNGTSMHWHGINQVNSSVMDGVNGVTECPIAPGSQKTYTFRATEHGTTWYHSHHSAQYGDGVLGAIVVNGPATSNYDIDLGVVSVTDFYYRSASIEALAAASGGPPTADNALINGQNMNVAKTNGSYSVSTLTAGKKHRVRLINTSVDNHFYVSLDSHEFTVIQADFVPIEPYNTTWLFIGIGQRYDVIVDASLSSGNYWFRAATQTCGSNANKNIQAIFNYGNTAVADPSSSAWTGPTFSCTDESKLVPWNAKSVDNSTFVFNKADTMTVQNPTKVNNLFTWSINGTVMKVDWEQPTLEYVEEGTLASIPSTTDVYLLPNADEWAFFIIQNDSGPAHPIHLHGHDFYVLGSAASVKYSSSTVLNWSNPPRRDVAMLPGNGYLVLAFQTNNPGAWLMHCHIAWHVGEGFAVQFVEQADKIAGLMDLSNIADECSVWDKWYATSVNPQADSGLRKA